MRILENLVTFLYNSKRKSDFHSAKENSLGSAVKSAVKCCKNWAVIRKTNQSISLVNTFIFVYFKQFLVKYLCVPFYKGSSGFSIWQMLNEITIRFYQYCVSQMPYCKIHITTLLLICARGKSYLPFASLSH